MIDQNLFLLDNRLHCEFQILKINYFDGLEEEENENIRIEYSLAQQKSREDIYYMMFRFIIYIVYYDLPAAHKDSKNK